jgi:2-hydroxychromene-2-carboxylate isomerase
MMRPTLEFWYDFSSTYSYLAAQRIDAMADQAGVRVVHRPFLLGPIFATQGLTSAPFNQFPLKGQYMWRDLEREAAALGLPFCRPAPFPQASVLAARIALVGIEPAWTPAFTRTVFTAQFGRGRDIGDPAVLADILTGMDLDADAVIAQAQSDANKLRLRRMVEEAQARGIFGAPAFVAEDRELFWGNDRLERALDWVTGQARRSELPV